MKSALFILLALGCLAPIHSASAQEIFDDPVTITPYRCYPDHIYTDTSADAPSAIAATMRAYRGALTFMQCDYENEDRRVFVRMREPKYAGVCRVYDQEITLLDEKALATALASESLRKVGRGYAPTGWNIDDPYSPPIDSIALGSPECPPLNSRAYVRVDSDVALKDYVVAFKKVNRLLRRLSLNSQAFDAAMATVQAPRRKAVLRFKEIAAAHALHIAAFTKIDPKTGGYELDLEDARNDRGSSSLYESFTVHVDSTVTKIDELDWFSSEI